MFLLGCGGWCWDKESCDKRNIFMSSSTKWPEVLYRDHAGIFGAGGPLKSWNRVWVPQCSSDAWMGDIGADESTEGVNWRGARIMRTALKQLVDAHGLRDGDTMIFGGLSAGARGSMVHLDTLKSKGLIPAGVKLLGYLDSPFYVEQPAFKDMQDVYHRVATQTQTTNKNMGNDDILRGNGACELD